jgi:hypothetical protein
MPYCSAVHIVWTSRSQDFGLKLNWEATGIGLVYSVPEWNADKTRVDKVDCSRTPVPRNRFVQVGAGSMEEAGSGHEDSSHNILTLDALVLSRSQVTPELSMSMRIRPI